MKRGVGTEFRRLCETLGIIPHDACECHVREERMNELGSAGCREHFQNLLNELHQAASTFSWAERTKAATKAVTTGLAFRLDPTDPIASMLREAIRRAEIAHPIA